MHLPSDLLSIHQQHATKDFADIITCASLTSSQKCESYNYFSENWNYHPYGGKSSCDGS